MTLTWDDWVALGAVALPLIAKALTDWSANATLQHSAALANITGMAGRQAATIARALQQMPPGVTPYVLESQLIAAATRSVLTEMSTSAAATGATQAKVSAVIQGELDKLVVQSPVAAAAATVTIVPKPVAPSAVIAGTAPSTITPQGTP